MDRDDPVPEADAFEQQQPVMTERSIQRTPEHDDVPVADWLEQSVAEPFDEEDR